MAKEKFFKRYPWALHLLLMLGVTIVLLLVAFILIRLYARQGKEFELPEVVGGDIVALKADNPIELNYVVMDSIYRPGEAGGRVLTQDPKPGTRVKKGRKVYITMTAYTPEDAVLPELAGLTVRQAVNELLGSGLEVGKLKYVDDPYKNNIVDQTCKGKTVYAGQQIERGAVIDLVVGLGDGTGTSVVPFVIGKTSDKARRDVLSASLNVGKEHYKGVKNKATAVVYRQEPDYTGVSRYPYGTQVELWYIDEDDTDVARMVSSFKVDSSKIIDPSEMLEEGWPTPDEIDERGDQW